MTYPRKSTVFGGNQHMRTRIKICGLTRTADLQTACALGVDAVGLVFYPSSPRHITLEAAKRLRQHTPALVSVVALFVNPSVEYVQQVLDEVQPTILQFHGEESPEFCARFQHPYFKAFRVGAPGMDSAAALARACQQHLQAAGWLFDSYSPDYGGSGISFDVELLADVWALKTESGLQSVPPLILSGGLSAATVGGMIHRLHPWAVDVSSGVETAKGIKSADKMSAFVRAVGQAHSNK